MKRKKTHTHTKCNKFVLIFCNDFESIFRGQENYRRLGFPTVSAVGSHAAMVRYIPTIQTDKQITKQEIYLLNAATQYKGKYINTLYNILFSFK